MIDSGPNNTDSDEQAFTVCDEMWLAIGHHCSPKEICYMHQALRGTTQVFTDPALLQDSIVNTLLSELSAQGNTHFYRPIILGTTTQPSTLPACTQAIYLKNKLSTFFAQKAYSLDNLKLIYHELINCNQLWLQERIIRGFFEGANASQQQRAFKTMAQISDTYPALAKFLIDFALFLSLKIDSRNALDKTALIECIYDHVKDANERNLSSILFLLNHGAQKAALTERQEMLLNNILAQHANEEVNTNKAQPQII